MGRLWGSTNGIEDRAQRSSAEDFALPSRGEAIVALRPALEAQAGPVLVTGEAGVGKTWLWRRLQAEMPPSWRWVVVDVPPAIDPTALYALIGHGLGLPARGIGEGGRLALADYLREATADGSRWALVLEEAHNGSDALLEEVRILANRLGHPDGLSALILVGQTSLACRLATRPLNALAARLAAHVHLRGLDVDEARAMFNCLLPNLDWDDRTLERHHRDAAGNPRRMLLATRAESVSPARRLRERPRVETPQHQSQPQPQQSDRPTLAPGASAALRDDWDTPVIGPVKPPLLVGDGMIEVGWESEHEPARGLVPISEPVAPATADDLTSVGVMPAEPVDGSEIETESEVETVETIDDHYAALQAWNEWARNQARSEVVGSPDRFDAPARLDLPGNTERASNGDPAQTNVTAPGVWVDGQQGFAPYSQLFSRVRQIRDAKEST